MFNLPFLMSYGWPWQQRHLIGQLARREFQARYRQSLLGSYWALLTPLLMLAVYTFVFRTVFKLRWSGMGEESDLAFALHLYAGLAVFTFFSDCVLRAPRLILEQAHLVKKVVFPLEILPWVNTLTAGVHLGVALLLIVAGTLWTTAALPWTALALPLVWLPLLPLCLGLSWLLASVGTYVRDLSQVLNLVVSLLMFLSPIFFPVEALPQAVRPWLALNPLALTMTQTRQVLLDGQWPDWAAWGWQMLAACVLAWLGARFFATARKGFADVL